MSEIVFTPVAVLDLLAQINELRGYNIEITEELNGNLQIAIGDSVYSISDTTATDIPVDNSVVDDISDVNVQAYEELSEQGEITLQPVESGVIKEIAKTLFVGGLVRLTGKLLR